MSKRNVFLMMLLLLLPTVVPHAKIIFGSERNGVRGIYIMDDDGSNQTLLIEGRNVIPESWTPDGKQILYDRGSVLFLMNPDGTNIRQVTENDGNYIGKCSFSPDGKFIVYDGSVKIDNGNEKYVVKKLNIETGKIEVILDIHGTHCDWSPDGRHIIFAKPMEVGLAGDVGGNTIWIMGADGDNPRELIPAPGRQADNFTIHRSRPRWSPNGQKIVWTEVEQKWEVVPNVGIEAFIKSFQYKIYDLKSRNIQQLKIPKDYDWYGIDWMDDGESIVLSASVGIPVDGHRPIPRDFEWPPPNIYKYHIKTGKITRLTDHPGEDGLLDWISDDVLPVSPKGKKKVTWGTVKQQGSE